MLALPLVKAVAAVLSGPGRKNAPTVQVFRPQALGVQSQLMYGIA
jgi:hypothetical protein